MTETTVITAPMTWSATDQKTKDSVRAYQVRFTLRMADMEQTCRVGSFEPKAKCVKSIFLGSA
jgi:hypothetical protein